MVVLDPEARCFIDSNQAAAEIFGYSSPEEVVGKTPLDMAATYIFRRCRFAV